jgi:hypothetical protein
VVEALLEERRVELSPDIWEPRQVVDTGGNPNNTVKSELDELQGSHPEGVQTCSFCLYVVSTGIRIPARKIPPKMSTVATVFSTFFI